MGKLIRLGHILGEITLRGGVYIGQDNRIPSTKNYSDVRFLDNMILQFYLHYT